MIATPLHPCISGSFLPKVQSLCLLLLLWLLTGLPAAAQTSDVRCGPDLYRPGIILSSSPVCGAVYSQHVPDIGRLHLGIFHALEPGRPDAGGGRVVNLSAGSFYELTDGLYGFADYGVRFVDGRAAAALYNDLIHYIGDDQRLFAGYEGVYFLGGFDRGYDSFHLAFEHKFRPLNGRLIIDAVAMVYWTRTGQGAAERRFSGINPWVEATYQVSPMAGPKWRRVMRVYANVTGFTGQPGRDGLALSSFVGIRTSF